VTPCVSCKCATRLRQRPLSGPAYHSSKSLPELKTMLNGGTYLSFIAGDFEEPSRVPQVLPSPRSANQPLLPSPLRRDQNSVLR
jgi:hypothetical protein